MFLIAKVEDEKDYPYAYIFCWRQTEENLRVDILGGHLAVTLVVSCTVGCYKNWERVQDLLNINKMSDSDTYALGKKYLKLKNDFQEQSSS